MNVLQHLNIHSIIDENSTLNSTNKEDSSEKARIAMLKSADIKEIHLFKISGKSTLEQLSRLKDNLAGRIQTSANMQEKAFLKAFYSIISHTLVMKSENKDIVHVNFPFHKEEIPYLNYRDLAILNEIDLFNNRISHQEQLRDVQYKKFATKGLHLTISLGKKLFLASKQGLIKLKFVLKKLSFPKY